ncbi:MAG: NAD-dependent epimerase/dehydratase family protein [Oligoflexales bacterium]
MSPTSLFESVCKSLKSSPKTWLVTGSAGFIGTNLVKALLELDQNVIGIDNYSTGVKGNSNFLSDLLPNFDSNYKFFEDDIANPETCNRVCKGVDVILHQAALGSVPRSFQKPIETNMSNVNGTLNLIVAANNNNIRRFVYASSSSVYGDNPDLPKREENVGIPLSPYAVSKKTCESYACTIGNNYDMQCIGLRYFNVFGPFQNPSSTYSAVIPKWIGNIANKKGITIFGDGETYRDFTFIDNVIQMNILAATTQNISAYNHVFNAGFGEKTSLKELAFIISEIWGCDSEFSISYAEPRKGDIKHSLADCSKAKSFLGYNPTKCLADGLKETIDWYKNNYHNLYA